MREIKMQIPSYANDYYWYENGDERIFLHIWQFLSCVAIQNYTFPHCPLNYTQRCIKDVMSDFRYGIFTHNERSLTPLEHVKANMPEGNIWQSHSSIDEETIKVVLLRTAIHHWTIREEVVHSQSNCTPYTEGTPKEKTKADVIHHYLKSSALINRVQRCFSGLFLCINRFWHPEQRAIVQPTNWWQKRHANQTIDVSSSTQEQERRRASSQAKGRLNDGMERKQ